MKLNYYFYMNSIIQHLLYTEHRFFFLNIFFFCILSNIHGLLIGWGFIFEFSISYLVLRARSGFDRCHSNTFRHFGFDIASMFPQAGPSMLLQVRVRLWGLSIRLPSFRFWYAYSFLLDIEAHPGFNISSNQTRNSSDSVLQHVLSLSPLRCFESKGV